MKTEALSGWTREQRHVVPANFLGWTLDAFDLFLLVFLLKVFAAEFHTDISDVTVATLLTLAMGPIGAFVFSPAADRWDRQSRRGNSCARRRSHADRIGHSEPRLQNRKPRIRSGCLCARTHARSNPERAAV